MFPLSVQKMHVKQNENQCFFGNAWGCLFISSLEKCYFFILLLLEIVAQWDYYYRVESMRKWFQKPITFFYRQ